MSKRLMVITDEPLLNVAVLAPVFVVISWWLHEVTREICNILLPMREFRFPIYYSQIRVHSIP